MNKQEKELLKFIAGTTIGVVVIDARSEAEENIKALVSKGYVVVMESFNYSKYCPSYYRVTEKGLKQAKKEE